MKTIITTLLLLFIFYNSNSQEFLTINIAQDLKLAVVGDDKNNEPFTPNIIIRSEWQGKGKDIGYGFVYPEFELAELNGGTYRRYTIGYGRTFYLDYLFNSEVLENFRGTISMGYGIMDYNGADFTFDVTSQLSYKFAKRWEAFMSWQIAERRDLRKYGESFRGSGSVGIKFYFFNTSWNNN